MTGTDTTISVSKKFRDWLKSKGKKGESYEDTIRRMLKPEYLLEGEEQYKGEVKIKKGGVIDTQMENQVQKRT